MTSVPAPTWKNFLHYVIPSVSAMIIFSSYTIIDGIFVSKGVSDLAMAAVNLSLPFINILSGVAILLSMGASTLCAFALGKGDHKEAERIFTQTAVIIFIVSAVITVVVALFADELAYLLGARDLTIGYASKYLHVVCLFSVCFIFSYFMEVMVKTDGQPQLAVGGMAVSFVVHIGLDYIFIFHMGLEVLGSALATGLAQLGSMLFFLSYFLSKRANLHFKKFQWNLRDLPKMLPLGIADCSIEFMLGFLTLLYNHVILATMGEEYLPIFAVIAYISILVYMVFQGIAQGMMPLVSLAVGHNEPDSVRRFLRQCILSVLVAAAVIEAVCQLAPGALVSLLLEGENTLFLPAVSALRQYALSYLPAGLVMALAGYFAAVGRGGASALLSLGRGFVLLPAVLLVFCAVGVNIWMAALIGEGLALFLGLGLFRRASRMPLVSVS